MPETFFFFFLHKEPFPRYFPATGSEKERRRKEKRKKKKKKKHHPANLSFLFSCRHDVTHFKSLSSDLFHHHITKGSRRQRVAATHLRHDGAHQSRHGQTHFWRSNSQLQQQQQQQRWRRRRRRTQPAGAVIAWKEGREGGEGEDWLDVFNR